MGKVEIWKSIDGFEDYEVSNLGRIKSLKYNQTNILKAGTDKDGYLHVVLCLNGNLNVRKVHRLVAIAFIPNPENKETVNHKDGNKKNNEDDNLEWNTITENIRHSFDVLKRKSSFGGLGKFGAAHCGSKKIIQLKDGIEINRFDSQSEAFRETGISYKHISEACNNKVKSAGGYQWQFAV